MTACFAFSSKASLSAQGLEGVSPSYRRGRSRWGAGGGRGSAQTQPRPRPLHRRAARRDEDLSLVPTRRQALLGLRVGPPSSRVLLSQIEEPAAGWGLWRVQETEAARREPS